MSTLATELIFITNYVQKVNYSNKLEEDER